MQNQLEAYELHNITLSFILFLFLLNFHDFPSLIVLEGNDNHIDLNEIIII